MRRFNPFAGTPAPEMMQVIDGAGAAGGGADAQATGDAGEAGDGGDDATGGESDAGGDAGDAEGHEGSRTEDDEDELLFGRDEDDQDDARPIEERHKALSQSHNKLKRRFGKAWPLVKALKKAGITDPDDVIQKVRSFDALLARSGGDVEKLLRLVQGSGGDDDDREPRRGADRMTKAEAKDLADEFNLTDEEFAKLWETNTAPGKFFMSLSRSHSTIAKSLKTALARIDQLEGGLRQKDEAGLRKEWVSTINVGAKKIQNPGIQRAYRNLMAAAYKEAGAKLDPVKVSGEILKDLGVNPTTSRIVQAAQQQRMATTNGQRPKHQAGGGGATQPARGTREHLADVHRRIRNG